MKRSLIAIAFACVVLALPLPTAAQPDDPAQSSSPPLIPATPPDFLLGRPKGLVAIRGGWLLANTGSDLYDFITDQLTVDKKNFDTATLSGDFGISIGSRFDVIATVEAANSTTASEYRDFVDTAGVAITQTTRREEVILSGTVRMALVPRGRRISRFAWVPRRLTPYVGVGAGALKYEFQQHGAFVNFQTLGVFNDTFTSKGWTPTVHALGGADLQLYRRLYLTTEARYTWSSAELSEEFVDFEPIDLAGLRMSAGLQFVF